MRDYELTFVVRPDIDDKQTAAAVSRVESLITSRGGELTNVQNWGKRRLAYPIGHHGEGSYFVYRLRMEPESQAEIEHELNLDEQVLRFITLYLDPVALEALKNPPPPMAPREPRRPREEPPAPPVEAPAAAAEPPAAEAGEATPPAETPAAEAPTAEVAETPTDEVAEAAPPDASDTAPAAQPETAVAEEEPAAESGEPAGA